MSTTTTTTASPVTRWRTVASRRVRPGVRALLMTDGENWQVDTVTTPGRTLTARYMHGADERAAHDCLADLAAR